MGKQHPLKQPIPLSGSSHSHAMTYQGTGKLSGKVALVSGGDVGIGQAVSVYFAKEGADVVIVCLNEHKEAKETKKKIESEGRRCLLITGDVAEEKFCKVALKQTIEAFGKLDILVNHASGQPLKKSPSDIFSYFHLTKAALKHLKKDGVIINTASEATFGNSKGIASLTRTLALSLANKKIRVNGVAPDNIWTPLASTTSDSKKVDKIGPDIFINQSGEPSHVAPCYVFLASHESSNMTGQILHPTEREFINI